MTTAPTFAIDNLANAYRAMAATANYRPAAPSDGFGNIIVPVDDLDLDAEAVSYATRWIEEENTRLFWVGCTDFTLAPATVYAIEAARNLCAGCGGEEVARRLLTMALDELRVHSSRWHGRPAEVAP